jgi:hypothetical protein
MLRLVTYYTPSHEAMCRRFVLCRSGDFDEVRATAYDQTCPSGAFKSDGWNECMLDKLNALMAVPCDGEPTLYVDADVALMPGIASWCKYAIAKMPADAVAFSDDVIQWCAGVMLFRATEQVRRLWQLLADLSLVWNLPDQDVLHQLRLQAQQTNGRLPITPVTIDAGVVSNWATVNAPAIPHPWDGEPFAVPRSCLAWHANWTVGIERKLRMLERVVLRETSDAADCKA